MSHWLGPSTYSTTSAAASLALAADLRSEAARYSVIVDLFARAHRAMPDGAECEGWMGRARTRFDERVFALAGATLAGSHYAEAAANELHRLATDLEESAAAALALNASR